MIFLTPGPTKTQSNLSRWMQEALETNVPNLSHRSLWFEDIFAAIVTKLRRLLNIPNDYVIAFTGSATEVWERSIQNLVEKESFHIINGEFSQRYSNFSAKLGRKNIEHFIEVSFDGKLNEIEVPQSSEAICFTQNETSTGMMFPHTQVSELARKYNDKFICLDIVSAAPSIPLDFAAIDCAFFSVQKGFGLPAGLGAVILSPRAVERSYALKKKQSVGTYHSFPNLVEHAAKNQTPETPNILGIWLLNKTLDHYLQEGITNIQTRTEAQWKYLTDELSKLGFPSLIQEPIFQSRSVVAAQTPTSAKELRSRLEKQGIYIGGGYGKFLDCAVRIANFPMHTSEDHAALLEALKGF